MATALGEVKMKLIFCNDVNTAEIIFPVSTMIKDVKQSILEKHWPTSLLTPADIERLRLFAGGKAHAAGLKQYRANGLAKWIAACKKARAELGIKGFQAVGGKTAAGKALYAKAKSYFNA
eukprot:TRINITY_DN9331_c0_g1_i1.p1 TRINITY_DN9331_c0_g1~~TRINITY_DN9331_c0_g1_i1.p1  ORF type:complete len:133 (-),score=30.75 TRINITY_DN9331_c0_g1_i1:173-532(-)